MTLDLAVSSMRRNLSSLAFAHVLEALDSFRFLDDDLVHVGGAQPAAALCGSSSSRRWATLSRASVQPSVQRSQMGSRNSVLAVVSPKDNIALLR